MTMSPRVRVLVWLAVIAALFMAVLSATGAHASTTPRRVVALRWAETHGAGCWYAWGGEGPCAYGFDCSGIVVAAYAHAGVSLPRTTYQIDASSKLVRIPIADAKRGDIMAFGSGHVELKTKFWHGTFGALEQGTRVGWHTWNSFWHPTAAYRLRW